MLTSEVCCRWSLNRAKQAVCCLFARSVWINEYMNQRISQTAEKHKTCDCPATNWLHCKKINGQSATQTEFTASSNPLLRGQAWVQVLRLRDSLSNHQPTLPPMQSYYIPHIVYTICHKSKTGKFWNFPFSISAWLLWIVVQLHPPPLCNQAVFLSSYSEPCIKVWWEDEEEAVVAPLTHSSAPLTLSAKTKNKVYPHNVHVVTPPPPPPTPTQLKRHREMNCGETLLIY